MLRAAAGQGPLQLGLSHLGSHLPCCNGGNFSLIAPHDCFTAKAPGEHRPELGARPGRGLHAHPGGMLPWEPRSAPGPSRSLMLLPGGPEAGSQAPAGFSLPPARSLRPSEVQQALQHSRGWHSTRAPRPLLLASSSSRPLQKRSPWCHQAGTGSTAQPGSHSSVNDSNQRDPGPTLTPAPRDAGGSC